MHGTIKMKICVEDFQVTCWDITSYTILNLELDFRPEGIEPKATGPSSYGFYINKKYIKKIAQKHCTIFSLQIIGMEDK